MSPGLSRHNLIDRHKSDAKFLSQRSLSFRSNTPTNFKNLLFSQARCRMSFASCLRSMTLLVLQILLPRSELKIVVSAVIRVSIDVTNFLAQWGRAKKRCGDKMMKVECVTFSTFFDRNS